MTCQYKKNESFKLTHSAVGDINLLEQLLFFKFCFNKRQLRTKIKV